MGVGMVLSDKARVRWCRCVFSSNPAARRCRWASL